MKYQQQNVLILSKVAVYYLLLCLLVLMYSHVNSTLMLSSGASFNYFINFWWFNL